MRIHSGSFSTTIELYRIQLPSGRQAWFRTLAATRACMRRLGMPGGGPVFWATYNVRNARDRLACERAARVVVRRRAKQCSRFDPVVMRAESTV